MGAVCRVLISNIYKLPMMIRIDMLSKQHYMLNIFKQRLYSGVKIGLPPTRLLFVRFIMKNLKSSTTGNTTPAFLHTLNPNISDYCRRCLKYQNLETLFHIFHIFWIWPLWQAVEDFIQIYTLFTQLDSGLIHLPFQWVFHLPVCLTTCKVLDHFSLVDTWASHVAHALIFIKLVLWKLLLFELTILSLNNNEFGIYESTFIYAFKIIPKDASFLCNTWPVI